MKPILNLGILAHVDAGKTSLTERLLYAAGVVDAPGRVDDGTTQTDTLALERQRGITIRSAVVSFALDGLDVNLIDTPGHPDFIAEVERVLSVLDGAVLVVSSVEGVQPQTRILMRTLQRLRIPTIVFVNKIDRCGARGSELLPDLRDRLGLRTVPMGAPTELGSRAAAWTPYDLDDPDVREALLDVLSQGSDVLLSEYVDDASALTAGRLHAELVAQTREATVHPVYFGSAMTGAGVESLTNGIAALLPPSTAAAVDGGLQARVFKIERGSAGEKVAYVRVFRGALRTRDRLLVHGREQKVTALHVFGERGAAPSAVAAAGRIAKVWGLHAVRIGDELSADAAFGGAGRVGGCAGTPRSEPSRLEPSTGRRSRPAQHPPQQPATSSNGPARARDREAHFAPPTLETVVVPARPTDRGALQAALQQLAEQDPLIDLRRDELRQETAVSLYGEVQKEVIQATLATDFGVEAVFQGSTPLCIERPCGTGEALEVIATPPNPFLATVGLRVEPAEVGSGLEFRLGIEPGALPTAFIAAVEETVNRTLAQGLAGWQVTDCRVTLTRSGYWARQSHAHGTFDKSMSSTAGDFRNLTPLVLMAALKQAGTRVHEPVHHFRLELPNDSLGVVLPALGRLGALSEPPVPARSAYVVEGAIPAARVHELRQALPTLTSGEGVLESRFDHYREVRGRVPPTRPRADHDPLDRKQYLLRVLRRVEGG